jgi:hypothetical protein
MGFWKKLFTSADSLMRQEWEFFEAVEEGEFEKVKEMLQDNPEFASRTKLGGDTALHRAARHGFKDMTVLLIATNKEHVNIWNNDGETPLHEAVRYGHRDVAEVLIANNANVNMTTHGGMNPLDLAMYKDNEDVLKLLQKHGARAAVQRNFQEVGSDSSGLALSCSNCGTVYRLGQDAIAITSEEIMGALLGAGNLVMGNMRANLMIGRSEISENPKLKESCETILRVGPSRGWTCGKCKHDNTWAPIRDPN